MDLHQPLNVGLGGDGDEIEAIGDVERASGATLDYAAAGSWITAGDVFEALLLTLPDRERDRPETWTKFAATLTGGTGVDPERIGPASPLLLPSRFWVRTYGVSATIWIIAAVGFLGMAIAALMVG